jgi:hypothetical protein
LPPLPLAEPNEGARRASSGQTEPQAPPGGVPQKRRISVDFDWPQDASTERQKCQCSGGEGHHPCTKRTNRRTLACRSSSERLADAAGSQMHAPRVRDPHDGRSLYLPRARCSLTTACSLEVRSVSRNGGRKWRNVHSDETVGWPWSVAVDLDRRDGPRGRSRTGAGRVACLRSSEEVL